MVQNRLLDLLRNPVGMGALGAGQPVEASRRGAVHGLVNQLRDPCLLVEDDRTVLLYAAGGESCIGAALVDW